MNQPDLSIEMAKVRFRNPVLLAAGILGLTDSLLKRVFDAGAGGVITKSISFTPRKGYSPPVIVEVGKGLINAMGLPNPGCKAFKKQIQNIKKEANIPVIGSIFGFTVEEFKKTAICMESAGVDMLELNISCPNANNKKLIGQDPHLTFQVVSTVKKYVNIPIITKLTPNVTDIVEIAKAAIEAGTDCISAINTVKALYIDIERGAPYLTNKFGGLSGSPIKPIALRCVAEIALYIKKHSYKIPIIGVGGIENGNDAIEFFMAGASAVQIGTGVFFHGLGIFKTITEEISAFMCRKGYREVNEMVGLALDKLII